MLIDYGVLPPEINSGRMYVGAGSGPMLAAAAAWDGLAAELHSAAALYSSLISGLTTRWLGPSSSAMAVAVAPYVAWMTATATRAEQTASQARTAAAAFENAFAETVPPPVIAANRARLLALVATNFFGQNTPAIMETQAEYIEMWAQDAAAMYGYAGSSAIASHLMPFHPPPSTTDPAGAARQAAALAPVTDMAPAHALALPQLMSAVPSSLQNLAAPAASTPSASAPASLASSLNTILGFATGPTSPLSLFGIAGVPELLGAQLYMVPQAGVNLTDAAGKLAAGAPAAGTGWLVSGTSGLGSAVSASVGRAGLVGGLAVPQCWAMAAPAVKPVAAVFAENAAAGAPAAAATTQGEGTLFGNMALSGLAGRAMAGTGGTAARSAGAATAAGAGEASGPVNIFIVPAAPK